MKKIKAWAIRKLRALNAWAKNAWSYMGWDDLIAVFLFVIGILGFVINPLPFVPILYEILIGSRSELIGIGIGVFVIGNFGEARNRALSKKAEKERLILQMGSPNNAFAVEAVRQLQSKGWHKDGSLRGAFLRGAFLRDVDLRDADLSGANLIGANLSGANLHKAALIETNLILANLVETDANGAKIRRADKSRAHLRGSKYDKNTIWPEGFDPMAAGVILGEWTDYRAVLDGLPWYPD